jgi:predicted transcriptional regulator
VSRGGWGVTRIKRPLAERFWAKVDRRGPDECWPWTGCRSVGYGQIREAGKGSRVLAAHRVALQLAGRPVPDGMFACHHCDHPECCNPAHLYAGTALDNSRDSHARKRHPHGIGVNGQRFDEWDIIAMRLLAALGFKRADIGRAFDLSPPVVSMYVRGTSSAWRGVPGANPQKLRRGRAGLTPAVARQIYSRVHAGESLAALGREFSVGAGTISLIRDRRIWASATAPGVASEAA